MKAREGDFVESFEGLFFDVKGLVHPSRRTIAFVRYFPDERGERRRKDGSSYDKVYSFAERFRLLRERYPKYVVYDAVFDETLCEVPDIDVRKRYDPAEKLSEFRTSTTAGAFGDKILNLAEMLKHRSNIPWSAIGISGSFLVDLQTATSDLDIIVYGSENGRKTHSALQDLLIEPGSPFKPYSADELKSLFDFRSKDTMVGFREFSRTESKKVFQGKFMGMDYFVRFVKDWNEIDEKYGDLQYKNLGYARVSATVVDDSESIFTPCTYVVEEAEVVEGVKLSPIEEIVSFRGRFCDQARNGDVVVARGKVEKVKDCKRNSEHLRLLIGNEPSDYMMLA